jgi:hypothetical protein
MIRLLLQIAATIIANAVGLLLAATLLTGFRIDALSFVIVLLVFSGVMILTGPLMTKIAITSLPQIRGAVALATAFVGLKVTDWLMGDRFVIGDASNWLSNWLAATLLVWLGSLLAEILLPIYVFKQLRQNGGANINIR